MEFDDAWWSAAWWCLLYSSDQEYRRWLLMDSGGEGSQVQDHYLAWSQVPPEDVWKATEAGVPWFLVWGPRLAWGGGTDESMQSHWSDRPLSCLWMWRHTCGAHCHPPAIWPYCLIHTVQCCHMAWHPRPGNHVRTQPPPHPSWLLSLGQVSLWHPLWPVPTWLSPW